jgi:hypothetical protein
MQGPRLRCHALLHCLQAIRLPHRGRSQQNQRQLLCIAHAQILLRLRQVQGTDHVFRQVQKKQIRTVLR